MTAAVLQIMTQTGLEERVFWQECKLPLDFFIIVKHKAQKSIFYAWMANFQANLKAELQHLIEKLLIEPY